MNNFNSSRLFIRAIIYYSTNTGHSSEQTTEDENYYFFNNIYYYFLLLLLLLRSLYVNHNLQRPSNDVLVRWNNTYDASWLTVVVDHLARNILRLTVSTSANTNTTKSTNTTTQHSEQKGWPVLILIRILIELHQYLNTQRRANRRVDLQSY